MAETAGKPLPQEHSSEARHGIGWGWLLTIVLVALVYRGLCFSFLHDHPLFTHPVVDAAYHDAWARRIVCGDWLGHGPDDVFKPPLYPYLLAAIYAVVGRHLHLVQWAQFVLGSVSCVFVAVLAARLLRRTAGILAGLISALYAPFVFFELQLLTPAISIFLNLAAMLLLVPPPDRTGRCGFVRCMCAGVVIGLSAGVRPDVVLPAMAVVFYLMGRLSRTSWRLPVVNGAWILAGFLVAVLPISSRNYWIARAVIPISSNAGVNFYVGNVAATNGTSAVPVGLRWERLVAQVPQEVLERPADASRWWRATAWRQMRADLGATSARLGRKLAAFWNGREFRNNISFHFMQEFCWPMRWSFGQYGLILPLAMCGLVALGRERWSRRDTLPICGTWVAGYLIIGLAFFVTARFRLPAVPFLIVPAAWTVTRVVRAIGRRQLNVLAWYSVGIVTVAVISHPSWFGSAQGRWTRDYVNLGNSLRAAGGLRDAQQAYRQALGLQSDDPDANYLLARLLLPSAPSQALDHLKEALRVLPDSPDLLLTTGKAYLALGQPDQARQTLNDLIKLSKTSNLWPKRAAWATAHITLARLESAQAATHWRQAWKIDPRTAAEASFLQRRDLDRVLATFRDEATEKTWDWYAQANHGMALLELGRSSEAVTAFRAAVRLAPERDALRFHLARALLGADQRAEAAAVLDQLYQTLPDCSLRRRVAQARQQLTATTAPSHR
jgi:tetratricopeptide (TPR) repeat protein